MPTLNEYFRTEAHDFLNELERSLQRSPGPDATELHRAVRGLRGTAQMARDQRIVAVVSAFESVTRSMAGDALVWTEQFAGRARDTIADLRALLDGVEDDEQLDARVTGAAERWGQVTPQAASRNEPVHHSTSEFREFAAREAAGIADTLDRGIQALQLDPMDREPLKSVLRRQRALLGSARLEEIPIVADILRAIQDLTHVVAKLDVGVKQEWLDIYRVARDALQTTIAPLLRDELPQPSNSVSRLRHMRAELLERYGTDEDGPLSATFGQPAEDDAPGVMSPDHGHPELDSGNAVEVSEDDVLDMTEDDVLEVTEDDVLEMTEDNVLELSGDDVLELSGDDVLELSGDDVLELSGDDVLELSEDSVVAQADVGGAGDVGREEGREQADGATIGIDTMSYTREDALRRALELRDVIARAAGQDPRVRAAVEELFDLIRIALG